jgi:uncharacterized phage-associated protein
MQETFRLDRAKFKDVVHIAIHHTIKAHGSEALGNTKLHKIVYFSDMLHYLESGKPLTGAEYQRQHFGPTARHLSWALRELEREGRIYVGHSNYYGYKKKEYASLASPKTNRITPDEANLVKHVADFVCVKTASEISEFSHDDVWASVPMGETIPYYAAFAMFPYEVTDKDIEEITREVEKTAPHIKAELSEGEAF